MSFFSLCFFTTKLFNESLFKTRTFYHENEIGQHQNIDLFIVQQRRMRKFHLFYANTVNLGEIVWYDALAPRPEVLLYWYVTCACAHCLEQNSKGLLFLFAFWPKLPILSTLWKNCDFSANSRCFIEFLVSKETRIIICIHSY